LCISIHRELPPRHCDPVRLVQNRRRYRARPSSQTACAGGPNPRKSGGSNFRKSGGPHPRKSGGPNQRKFCKWRLHRQWYQRSALADLLGLDRVIYSHALYDCHDRLLEHKAALFAHLVGRWRDLFNVSFDVLLYDLTSTYFEIDPPLSDEDKRRFGYS